MNARSSRRLLWTVILVFVSIAIGFSFRPKTVVTDIDIVARRDLLITVKEEGRTRIHDTYVVSSPVTGFLRRIDADVGDPVKLSETIVASIEPIDPAFLDTRTEAQAKADIDTAASSTKLAQAQVDQVEAELEFALNELSRMRQLGINNSISQRELDAAERSFKTTRARLATAQASLQMRLFEQQRAKAQLMSPAGTQQNRSDCECINITAPINGKVLKIMNRSEGVVEAGTPLIEIGDPRQLEIVVELLSFDAVKVEVGQRVIVSNWGGDNDLVGHVSQIEPIGFKKISALGIEEQRVNVIVAFTSDFSKRLRLGHNYQVDVAIILVEKNKVLSVPISALFRHKDVWAVYAVVNNKIKQKEVRIGERNEFYAEVISGLMKGDAFIVHPNEQTGVGVRVEQRALQN